MLLRQLRGERIDHFNLRGEEETKYPNEEKQCYPDQVASTKESVVGPENSKLPKKGSVSGPDYHTMASVLGGAKRVLTTQEGGRSH